MWALLLAVVPWGQPDQFECDIVELNHYYSDEGCLVFTQWIFWQSTDAGLLCDGWAMVDKPWNITKGKLSFMRAEKLRVVRFREFKETWTQHDPERENLEKWPQHKRGWEN